MNPATFKLIPVLHQRYSHRDQLRTKSKPFLSSAPHGFLSPSLSKSLTISVCYATTVIVVMLGENRWRPGVFFFFVEDPRGLFFNAKLGCCQSRLEQGCLSSSPVEKNLQSTTVYKIDDKFQQLCNNSFSSTIFSGPFFITYGSFICLRFKYPVLSP